ncbi:MAG: UDP-N-acetylglucosamine--N-acetylmuramyl-(pentapeptide) pyrophosphoryl-undecaprenol N-acetylglucosamine transferase [Kiritimatiellae bacterium]|nr:UDP-N-acetylglucosamine--N-acetylmuramyl-(pentapeptide) pyrophosphoryl-undecaprenol N-acetylglucosamine transferase [Kiritimatiellia bacterium]
MNIAIACGGTGGHAYPGLATAEELRRRGHEVTLWFTGRDSEKAIRAEWTAQGGRTVEIPSKGLNSFAPHRALGTLLAIHRATVAAAAAMRADRPDALLAMGSYASAGPCRAALSLGVPVVLHEANVIPGRMIACYARRAATVAVGFEETRRWLRKAHVEAVGIPVRRRLAEQAAEAAAVPRPERAPGAPLRLLVTGGSLGAAQLNRVAAEAVCAAAGRGLALSVVHLAGARDEAAVRERYAAAGVDADVRAYESDMAPLYAAADLALCRAGGSTCSELALFGLPALLVPYPHAAKDHQTANAEALERRGCADRIPERDLTAPWLENYLAEIARRPDRLERMRAAARRNGIPEGTAALADCVERAARQNAPAP